MNLDSIFTAPARTLDAEEEATLVALAKDGSELAKITLIQAYLPALRHAIGRYSEALGADDARAEAVAAFLELVDEFDGEKGIRLAGVVAERLSRALSSAAASQAAFSIPDRTLQRFYGILRRAGGDATDALGICGKHGMSREVFLSVLHVLRATDSLDAQTIGAALDNTPHEVETFSLWGEYRYDDEDRLLVEVAFTAVDDFEADVCRLAYGFTEYDPVPDAEIASRLGYSRPTIQRTRSGALAKMRSALGA